MSGYHCSRCKAPVYKNGMCIDHYRKLGMKKGRRTVRRKKKEGDPPSVTEEAVTHLVAGMNKTKGFSKMLKYSLGCIKQLAVDEVAVEDIISCGAIKSVMEGWGDNKEDEEICSSVCEVICSTTINPDVTAQICKDMEGRYGLFTHALETHLLDDTIIETIRAMHCIAKDPRGRQGLLEAGALEALAKSMREHPHSAAINQYGAMTLAELAVDPANAKRIMKSGAVQDVLNAMKKNPKNQQLAEAGAALLAKLAEADPSIAAELKRMGAIDYLVSANEMFPHSKYLTEQSRTALRHLAGEEDMLEALGQIRRGEIKSGTAKKGSTAKALSKVATLCLVPENVDYMHKNQGVAAVVAVLKGALEKGDKDAQDTLTQGFRALARLAGDESQSYAVMKGGGVRAMVSALGQHADNAELCEAAIRGLAAVQDRAEHAAYVNKVGGTDAVFGALEKHENNPIVAAAVLQYMDTALQHEDAGRALIQNGGAHALTALLNEHKGDPTLTEAALMTMASMAALGMEGQEALIEANALQAMVEALEAHPDDPDALKAGLKAMLEVMSDNQQARAHLKKFGAMEAITAALDNFPGDPELQALGGRALRLLAEAVEIKAAKVKAEQTRTKVQEREDQEQDARAKKLNDDLAKNMRLWEEMMRQRKAGESERLQAYKEMKRREAEMVELKKQQTEAELARRNMLEKQSQAIREQQEMITRIKREKEERVYRKEVAKREQFEKDAWARYDNSVANRPDEAQIKARSKMRAMGDDGDESVSESDDDDF